MRGLRRTCVIAAALAALDACTRPSAPSTDGVEVAREAGGPNDAAAPDAPVRFQAGAPCLETGPFGGVCTEDGKAIMTCRSNVWEIASSCRGTRGCAFHGALGGTNVCDTSIAEPGDACSEEVPATTCTRDLHAVLACEDRRRVARPCAAGFTCTHWTLPKAPFTEGASCKNVSP